MPAGRSIIEMYWAELDRLYDMAKEAPNSEATRGRMQGVAWCLAVILNPYNPNIENIRREAKLRYQARARARKEGKGDKRRAAQVRS